MNLTHANLAQADAAGANLKGADLAGIQGGRMSLRGSDLAGDDLAGASLVAADLRRADLMHADLRYATLTDTDVDRSNLRAANLLGVHGDHLGGIATLPQFWSERYGFLFGPGAQLAGEEFDSLQLGGLDLWDANLSATSLKGALLFGSVLAGANLSHATGDGADAADVDLAGANLTAGSWKGAQLVGADLSGATLYGSDLTDAVLTQAKVAGTNLDGAVLTDINSGQLQGTTGSLPSGWLELNGYLVGGRAELGDAQLAGQNLAGADLAQTTLPNADLEHANLSSDVLTSSDLLSTDLTGASVSAQSLSGAVIGDSELAGANLTGTSGVPVQGSPQSLPGGWADESQKLVRIPSSVPSGSNFDQGQWIEAPNGQFTVNMQSDGNLVEYQGGTAIWASGTSGAVQTVMQTDCNFVIYRAGQYGQPAGALYTTGTGGDPSGNCSFAVADDGSLSVATSDGTVRWARYANGTLFSHRIQMSHNAPLYSAASASSSQIGTIPAGDSPDYVCWTTGPKVGNVDVYFYVLWSGVAGYYPSYYDNSVYASDSRISIDDGIPRCGSVPSTFTPPSNGTLVPPGPSTIAAPIDTVAQAGIYSGPAAAGNALAVMPAGTNPGFICWTTGQRVNNVTVWFKVYWGGQTGYYPSGLDNSSYSSDLEIAGKYGVPFCGGGTGAVAPQPVPTPPASTSASPEIEVPVNPPAVVRVCPSQLCDYEKYLDGSTVEWQDGHPVSMLCWWDSTLKGGYVTSDGPGSARWFAVYMFTGADGWPEYGWIFSRNVANQAKVPNCYAPSSQWVLQYISSDFGLDNPGPCPNNEEFCTAAKDIRTAFDARSRTTVLLVPGKIVPRQDAAPWVRLPGGRRTL